MKRNVGQPEMDGLYFVCGCPDFNCEGTSEESMAAYIMMNAWKEKLT